MSLDLEEGDGPAGYPDVWGALTDVLRTHYVAKVSGQWIGRAQQHPDADELRKARYRTEEWKAQHRVHARESARRRRAAKKGKR